MNLIDHALRGGHAGTAERAAGRARALVVGGGGALGSALLGEALAGGRFDRVAAVVTGPLQSALRGFDPLPAEALFHGRGALGAEVAFIVFERVRHSNGRDDAFYQPDATELVALARTLHERAVSRLLVVVPHAPALLPHALKGGFASQDEHAVGTLGFEHLVLLRAAQTGGTPVGSGAQRFVAWWLGQLRWMVPSAEQPVRAVRLAALVVQLARLLPQAPPGTRVVPPELLSAAAAGDAETIFGAWLGHR